MPNPIIEAIKTVKTKIAQVTKSIIGKDNQKNSELKEEIKKIRDTLNGGLSDLDELLNEYKKMVDEFYGMHPPFKNQHDEIVDFIELIGHSQVIGNFALLDKWAIEYPANNRVLTQPISTYRQFFQIEIIGNWDTYRNKYHWTDDVKEFWEYLIREFNNQP